MPEITTLHGGKHVTCLRLH